MARNEQYPPPQGVYPPPQQSGPPGTVPGEHQRWQAGQGGGQPYQWDNDEDDGSETPGNTQTFQGYETTGSFGQAVDMAPPPPPPPPSGAPPPMEALNGTCCMWPPLLPRKSDHIQPVTCHHSVPNLNEEQCREALLAWVAEHCCYGKGCAQQLEMAKLTPSTALHYSLETFCEARSTGRVHEPYRGGYVDGPHNGMPPPPWSISVQPDDQFYDHTKRLEVPHTSEVQVCHRCRGRGFIRCYHCHGMGHERCHTCHGSGHVHHHNEHGHHTSSCYSCGGSGRKICYHCGGDGRVTCGVCDGFGRIRCFIQLTVRFMNHLADHIMEKTDMPDELVQEVGGVILFQQTLPQVWPLSAYPVQEISQNSQRIVEQHRQQFPTEKQLNQRQTLRAVAVTEVVYKWKDVTSRFWVYGMESKVHAPDYPQTCCWGCTIL